MKNTLLSVVLLLSFSAAQAVEYTQVLSGESEVTFSYWQMGVPLEGKFNQLSAQLHFDPVKPDKAQAKIDIGIASIDTGSDEANAEVVGKPWFNAQAFPVASFVSSGLKALGGDRYEVSGKLSIKGRTLDVKVPVTFRTVGKKGRFEGVFSISRLDYAIGEGAWSDVDTVANEIQIRFRLTVAAVPSRK